MKRPSNRNSTKLQQPPYAVSQSASFNQTRISHSSRGYANIRIAYPYSFPRSTTALQVDAWAVSEFDRLALGRLILPAHADRHTWAPTAVRLRPQTELGDNMTHAALAPRIGREFDPFLFASIGEDRHGQLLSVISALGRSGLDPWQEAIDLAQMSRDLATARLSRLIAALPGEPALGRRFDAIAGELVALLPRSDKFAPPPHATPAAAVVPLNVRFGLALSALALVMTLSLLFSTQPPVSRHGGPPSEAIEKPSARLLSGNSDRRP